MRYTKTVIFVADKAGIMAIFVSL